MLGRPKLSIAVAETTGALKAHPERYVNDVELSLHPLGPPSPVIIEEGLLNEWMMMVRCVSWLTEADRRLVELACKYRANGWELARQKVPFIDDDGVAHPDIMLFQIDHRATGLELRILEKLGCTPTNRPKVTPAGKFAGGKVKREKWW